MPLIKMLLQFLWLWVLAFPVGLFAAAWYNLSDTAMAYGLLFVVIPFTVHRFPKTQQRPFSPDEQFAAVAGLTIIVLGVNLALTTLLTPGNNAYSISLDPPLPLSVTQGLIALQTPLYSAISWLFVRNANARFPARRSLLDSPAPTQPLMPDKDISHIEAPLEHPRRDTGDYLLNRPRG